jgi:hypothetical protein
LLGQGAPITAEGADLPVAPPPPAPPVADVPSPPLPLAPPSLAAPVADVSSLPLAPPTVTGADSPAAEPVPDAPLLGQGAPITAESAPLATGAEAADEAVQGDAEPVPSEQPLAVPHPPAAPRAGLGQPMSDLPTTATSWDLTRMSRAEQLQMSRALIQSQMAGTTGSRGPVRPPMARPLPLPAPAAAREQSGPRATTPVLAGMPLPRVAIENVGPPSPGLAPDQLPPVGDELAPLLSSDPLFAAPATETAPAGAAPSPPSGARARAAIGQRHGVDLSNVPVDRSPEGASEAYRMRARAFTSDRGIVIPAPIGTLESGPGEALLSHELTHIAQRARYGPNLPDESTPAGRLLEADALATEMTLNNGAPSRSAPLELPSAPRQASWSGLLDRSTGSETGQPLPLAAPTPTGPDPDSLAASILERMSVLSGPGMGQVASEVFTPASWSMGPTSGPAMAGGGVQRAEEAVPAVAPAPTPAATNPEENTQASMNRPSDEDLTNLSRWLYPLIRYKLKGELREDRERAGMLTDHYGRW